MSNVKKGQGKKGPTAKENKEVKSIEVKDEVVVEPTELDNLPLNTGFGKDEVPEDEVTFKDENKEALEAAEKALKEKEAKEVKEVKEAEEAKEAAKEAEKEAKDAENLAEEAKRLAEKEAKDAEKAKKEVEDAEKEVEDAAAAIEVVASTLSTENKAAIDHLISRFKDRSQGRGKIIQPSRGGKYVNTATREQWIPVSLVYSIAAEILKLNE